MSDNEDERLDRAKRIRQMREGSGRQDEPADADENNKRSTGDNASPEESDNEGLSETHGEPDNEPDEESSTGQEDSGSEDEVPSPEVTVPETANLELDGGDKSSLEAEDVVRAPLPDSAELEEALESSRTLGEASAPDEGEDPETATPSDVLHDDGGAEEETRVLDFKLSDEYYCLDIEYIEEIVKEETITRVPNTPDYVEGVVDLRGQITTILNPKVTIKKDDVTPGNLIIVFDSGSFEDQRHIGWVVDDVRQVSPIIDSEVNESPVEEEYINGIIDREDDQQFVIWTEPSMAMEEAE